MTNATHRILIVEDDNSIQKVLRMLLEAERFRTMVAATCGRAERDARSFRPDAVILDLGLPDRDGINFIKDVRVWSAIPILVLSARVDEPMRLAAFNAGADDYVAKPFSAPELVARLRALLRRYSRGDTPMGVVDFETISVDLSRRVAHAKDGIEVHFTPVEHRILETLVRNVGRLVTYKTLLHEVWGPHVSDTRSVRVYIGRLRQKLERDPAEPKYILNEPGLGYRLVLEYSQPAATGTQLIY